MPRIAFASLALQVRAVRFVAHDRVLGTLRITTLGEFSLAGPRGAIATPLSEPARSLAIALARTRRPFARDELAARWWPDAEPHRARASLSTALWTLRSALRAAFAADPLRTTRDRIALDERIVVEIDAERFETAIAAGDDAAAESWYGGPYLRGSFDDDVVAERERLAAMYAGALARLLHADPDAERARRLLAADPYAEIAYRVLVDAARADGSTTAARAWLRRARTAFAELGSTPAFAAHAPYLALAAVDDAATPRTNLTADSTSFVGRRDDVRAIEDALESARVVTLLGAGGSGKTRLAREVALRALGIRTTAAWFVELAPVAGSGAVAGAIAATLGVPEQAHTPADAIVAALRASDAFVILDNCEHVVDEAAEIVARLAREAPALRIIVTSREALRVDAERIVPIDGLSTPDAVELFVTRARAADRRFAADDEAVRDARRIAEALDGLPLALELAAGRVRIDGLRAIADDALRVVRAGIGPRDRAARSQTIGASIDWSVERLDPAARLLFGRLGAFAGGFDAQDAAALDLDASGALDRLIDRSLVVRSDPFDVALRLLAPVRADARLRLAGDARCDAVLDAHAERVRANALTWHGRRGGEAGAVAESRLDALAADIDVALDRLFARGRADAAIDLIAKLGSHWTVRGARTLAERWFARADAAVADDKRRGDIAYARVRFAHDAADVDEQLRLGAIARSAYERAGDIGGEARACNVIGSGLINALRIDEARVVLSRSLELQRRIGDEYGIAVVLSNLGVVAVNLGDHAAALAAYTEAEPILNRVATIQPRIKVQNNIAFVRMLMGDRDACARASERAVALAEASDNETMVAFAAANAAVRAARFGDYAAADELARRVGTLADPPPGYAAYALIARAAVARARGQDAASGRFASAARLIERTAGAFEPFEAEMLAALPGAADDAVDRDPVAVRALLSRAADPVAGTARASS